MKTIATPGAAGNSAIRFPHRRIAAVFVFCEEDGPWLVLGPRGHGWAHGDRHVARADAEWLAHNFGLPIRFVESAR
jgi:hypothetical protein